MLILAVVAIRAVSNDGIIGHAKNAKTKYEQAQLNEASILAGYEDKITATITEKLAPGLYDADGNLTKS